MGTRSETGILLGKPSICIGESDALRATYVLGTRSETGILLGKPSTCIGESDALRATYWERDRR